MSLLQVWTWLNQSCMNMEWQTSAACQGPNLPLRHFPLQSLKSVTWYRPGRTWSRSMTPWATWRTFAVSDGVDQTSTMRPCWFTLCGKDFTCKWWWGPWQGTMWVQAMEDSVTLVRQRWITCRWSYFLEEVLHWWQCCASMVDSDTRIVADREGLVDPDPLGGQWLPGSVSATRKGVLPEPSFPWRGQLYQNCVRKRPDPTGRQELGETNFGHSVVIFFFPYNPLTPSTTTTHLPSHPRELDFGAFPFWRVSVLARFGSVRRVLGPPRVRFGSVLGCWVGSGWGRWEGFRKGKEYRYHSVISGKNIGRARHLDPVT